MVIAPKRRGGSLGAEAFFASITPQRQPPKAALLDHVGDGERGFSVAVLDARVRRFGRHLEAIAGFQAAGWLTQLRQRRWLIPPDDEAGAPRAEACAATNPVAAQIDANLQKSGYAKAALVGRGPEPILRPRTNPGSRTASAGEMSDRACRFGRTRTTGQVPSRRREESRRGKSYKPVDLDSTVPQCRRSWTGVLGLAPRLRRSEFLNSPLADFFWITFASPRDLYDLHRDKTGSWIIAIR